MRPFELNPKFLRAWIDLDSIQVIHEVCVFPQRFWTTSGIGPAFFAIQYAHSTENRVISVDEPVDESDYARVYQDIHDLHETRRQLVTAWLQEGPR